MSGKQAATRLKMIVGINLGYAIKDNYKDIFGRDSEFMHLLKQACDSLAQQDEVKGWHENEAKV